MFPIEQNILTKFQEEEDNVTRSLEQTRNHVNIQVITKKNTKVAELRKIKKSNMHSRRKKLTGAKPENKHLFLSYRLVSSRFLIHHFNILMGKGIKKSQVLNL